MPYELITPPTGGASLSSSDYDARIQDAINKARILALILCDPETILNANVNAQKPKPPEFESGGVFLGPDQQYTGGGGVPAVLHPPETILNGEQMKKVFDMINNEECQ